MKNLKILVISLLVTNGLIAIDIDVPSLSKNVETAANNLIYGTTGGLIEPRTQPDGNPRAAAVKAVTSVLICQVMVGIFAESLGVHMQSGALLRLCSTGLAALTVVDANQPDVDAMFHVIKK